MQRFNFLDEKFADIQMLRYELKGWEQLSIKQKLYIYYLSKATLWGRDITTDQFGKYNLSIRKLLEHVYPLLKYADENQAHQILVYLKRVWFSNGIYHHYGCEKFVPAFSRKYFEQLVSKADPITFNVQDYQRYTGRLLDVMFNPDLLPMRVNKKPGDDLVLTSACNYYDDVTQQEAVDYYNKKRQDSESEQQPSWGLNTKLVKQGGMVTELPYTAGGLYGAWIQHIIYWLSKAEEVAENEQQKLIIKLLINYYQSGDLKLFDEYSIEWLKENAGSVDFINGFIEVYGDPLGIKGSWEGLVEFVDKEASKRTEKICSNAQWFEDHSPIDECFKKSEVTGVSARVINAAMLGGDEYPSSAIGINLPNADWIRKLYGSKSITIGNLTEAYNEASKGNGFYEEYTIDGDTLKLIMAYADMCDDLHTDLHECLGHGSGKLAPNVNPNALQAYANTIEEARADLFALYYIADPKLIELGLLPSTEAFKASYYTYVMNGALTQCVRLTPGSNLEEAHMQNRALISNWALDMAKAANAAAPAVEITERNGKHYVQVNDYHQLRDIFASELKQIQRIKSTGDYKSARNLVEKYGVHVDAALHAEVRQRYEHLNISPYKGFINPKMTPVFDANGDITDIKVDYTEGYEQQMLRYSREYSL